jgi:hypothetical protein
VSACCHARMSTHFQTQSWMHLICPPWMTQDEFGGSLKRLSDIEEQLVGAGADAPFCRTYLRCSGGTIGFDGPLPDGRVCATLFGRRVRDLRRRVTLALSFLSAIRFESWLICMRSAGDGSGGAHGRAAAGAGHPERGERARFDCCTCFRRFLILVLARRTGWRSETR